MAENKLKRALKYPAEIEIKQVCRNYWGYLGGRGRVKFRKHL